ncbi:MAG: hypothetical protein ACKO04_03025 [Actinomycetes bacterium]
MDDHADAGGAAPTGEDEPLHASADTTPPEHGAGNGAGNGVAERPEDSPSGRRPRRGRRLLLVLAVVAVVAAVLAAVADTPGVTTFAALLTGLLILRVGWFFLQSFATPPPPPPDRGTLRRVRLVYRCNVCGAEVRMTVANDEDPEPPRHCMDDMQLLTPID